MLSERHAAESDSILDQPIDEEDLDNTKEIIQARLLHEQTSLGKLGLVVVEWSADLSKDEIADLRTWFNLVLRKIKRSCGHTGEDE